MTALGASRIAPERASRADGTEEVPFAAGTPLSPQLCDHESHCITCGDEAVPLTVVKVDVERQLALCENAAGERTTVEIALVAPVAPEDVLLVHAGTAIARAA